MADHEPDQTNGPLRIVHALTHSKVTRGGAVQAMILAKSQRAAGHEVRIAVNSRPGQPLHDSLLPWKNAGFEIRQFKMSKVREVIRFRRYLREARPDVLHCHRNDALQFAWFALTGMRPPPVLVTQRGTTRGMQTRLVGVIHRSRRIARVIAVAEAVKDSLVNEGVNAERIRVVYGSCDVARFDPARADGTAARASLGIEPSRRLVVQVGELIPKKAPLEFIKAAAVVAERRSDVAFALVGPGKLMDECIQLRDQLGLRDNLLLPGFRSDIPEIYAAADVAVNCSVRDEGLTGALREALAMATPVVATRISGNPELVRDGETGLLVPPGDPQAMAAAVLELLDDPERARALGAAGRERVLAKMSPTVRLAATMAVYREALAESRRPRPVR